LKLHRKQLAKRIVYWSTGSLRCEEPLRRLGTTSEAWKMEGSRWKMGVVSLAAEALESDIEKLSMELSSQLNR
jgi:hypothetical protein